MTTVQPRFSDENYRNWLKTAESLYILRSRIQDFIEKETETYHTSLQKKLASDGQKCEKCELKKLNKPNPQLCDLCNSWKKEILINHNNPKSVHWENFRPHLWPAEKWEVAKVYMPRVPKAHCEFVHFDIAAILNLMSHCKHFKDFSQQSKLSKVINVRNTLMHSPDLKLNNKDMEIHQEMVLTLAEDLKPHVPGLENLKKEISQFNKMMDKNFSQASQSSVDGKQEDIQNMKEFQKLLDREQQALKERIEALLMHFEGDQDERLKEEPQSSKNLLDFLYQNKDLLENLGPQVHRLKEMQDKVDQHDQQISSLTGRVDQLERGTLDPVFSDIPLKYKNHLYEYSLSKKWPEPKFTEKQEAQGYRGRVDVNGKIFTGTQVWNSIKAAHQEVAKIALEQMRSQFETTDESSSSSTQSVIQPEISSSASSGVSFFGKVTVALDQEVESDGCYLKQEDATESAYKVLGQHFCISAPVEGQTYKSVVVEYFKKWGFPTPSEHFDENDNKTICKLKLSGHFKFHDTDGSTKKREAEQQAAKVALKHLSGILNCGQISDDKKNFKGVLKERLEALGLNSAVYETENAERSSGESVKSDPTPDLLNLVNQHLELKSKSISTPVQLSCSGAAAPLIPDPQDPSSPASNRKMVKIDRPGVSFFGKVTVVLDREVESDGCYLKQEEATESAYKILWQKFGISSPNEGQTHRSVVMEYFKKWDFPTISENFDQNDNNTICKLKLNGPFKFDDTDGSTKKREAEQQAAKVALQHLSGILNCGPISDDEKNFKGVLKERLEALGQDIPIYETKNAEGSSGESVSGSTPDISNSMKQNSEPKSERTSTPIQPLSSGAAVPSLPDPQDSSSPASHRKRVRIDCPEIEELFVIFNLKPPHVNVENFKYDQNFQCTVKINLENWTFTNNKGYDSKKDAIRNAYLLFGCAMCIFGPSTDEKKSSAQVKQHFSQKSLPLPQEDFECSTKAFVCSLKNITYSAVYEGQGSSESEAKLQALQKSLQALSPLFGYPSLTGSSVPEDVEYQLSSMLKRAGQKDPVISMGSKGKACIEMSFNNYTVKSPSKGSKREARNHLSSCLLGLLGVEIDPASVSLRNCLDEWFIQRKLPQPVFEDTEEALGAKATFSVQLTCCSPDWEDSWETAKEKLVKELKHRFKFLTD